MKTRFKRIKSLNNRAFQLVCIVNKNTIKYIDGYKKYNYAQF